MKSRLLVMIVLLFVFILTLSLFVQGTGVIKNDLSRNIYIPDELTTPLQVKAAFNDQQIFFRFRWPSKRPNIYHDMLVYEAGKWVRHGASVAGPHPEGIYEDRLTMLVDDGSIPEFSNYGAYITIGDAMRFFTDTAGKKEVAAHPYLGKIKNKKDVRKYLPETRTDINNWASLVDTQQLQALRKAGYFLDLWHWRAHRSNPIDKSDDQFVAEYRYGDKGKGVYYGNWDKAKNQPKLMFDPQRHTKPALQWQDLLDRKLGFDDVYYLREDQAVPFDSQHAWQEGDTIPRRVLRAGSGSHADISVQGKGRWQDGFWDVTLVRKLDTGNPLDDKAFYPERVYTLAFAVHRDATGSRWHYVSLPFSLGLNRSADISAHDFTGEQPDWNLITATDITLFYPGQVSWPFINSAQHAGYDKVAAGVPVKQRHSEIQLAKYAVELEFSNEIKSQWVKTFWSGILLILAFGIAINLAVNKGEK